VTLNSFYARIQALVSRWAERLNVNGDYAEVWCVPSATLVPRTDRSQNKATGIILFVTFLCKSLFYLKTKEFMTRHLFFLPHIVGDFAIKIIILILFQSAHIWKPDLYLLHT